MRVFITATVVLTAALISACASVSRTERSIDDLVKAAPGENAQQERVIAQSLVTLADRVAAQNAAQIDILMLSGGGQNGAYGMGFMRGWQQNADFPMPEFDIIAGISTGALQVPFVAFNDPADLARGAGLFRNAADSFAPTLDWWFWLRPTGGLVNTRDYEATIAEVVDTEHCQNLQPIFAEGRQLFIGTTNLDLATGRAWDINTQMGDCSDLSGMHDRFYASTAIPGIFPPRMIDNHLHVDGGVVSNMLVLYGLGEYRQLAELLAERGVTENVEVRVWVILNLWTHMDMVALQPSKRRALSDRSRWAMFWAQQPQVLERLESLALAVSYDVPGLTMRVHHTGIPSTMATEPGATELFNRAWMERIEQFGFDRAQSDAPWDTVISPFIRP
ncbi:patatin-like phospholipase family protein [Salinispirillum sp. LH 10-3-1]|uniref:Patatin-like phospholipase family protein n=1 Tax=Salinispirillum sp. LH 10-3-1 TaxID=2952525 RepID=A0AB38YK76_9GAMM